MNFLRRIMARLQGNRNRHDLDEEIAFHIEATERELREQGLSQSEAYRQARVRFGSRDSVAERVHSETVLPWESIVQDLGYSLRVLRKSPGFASVVVLSLGLGIGANVAIFTVMNAVMLKSLPVREPETLVLVNNAFKNGFFPEKFMSDYEGSTYDEEHSGLQIGTSMPTVVLETIQKNSTVFDTTFAFAANEQNVNVGLAGRAESGKLQGVSGGYFNGLGVVPAAGRIIEPSDDDPSAPPVVVVSYKFFLNQFGGDPNFLGKTVTINDTPAQLIGVAPPDFFGLDATVAPDFWIPLSLYRAQWTRSAGPDENLDSPLVWWLTVVGRTKPEITLQQAQAETAVIFAQAIHAPQAGNDPTIPSLRVESASRGLRYLRNRYSSSLWLLASIAAAVLLIACANVAALMLARAAARQKEVATRLSLGAARGRLVRQLMTESLLLALAGGALGIMFSYWLTEALLQLLNDRSDPLGITAHLGPLALLFGLAVSLLCCLLFGLAPALRATRVTIGSALKQGAMGHSGESRFWSGKALVALQIALCVLLVAAAGLMTRTLYKLQRVNLGFHPDHVAAFSVRPGLNGYDKKKLASYYEEVLQRVEVLPGVASATYSQFGPIGEGQSSSSVYIPGFNTPEKRSEYYRHIVGDHYFATLGIPILLGRPLGEQDTSSAKPVIVINETMMRKYFAGQNPLGRQVGLGSRRTPINCEIVGVARDVRYARIRDEVPPTIYFPLRQSTIVPGELTFFLRHAANLPSLQRTVAATALQLDPSVPAVKFREETTVIERHLSPERAFAGLSSGFAAVGLLLACIGLYGTMAYMVTQRTREIGVRLALGAGRAKILGLVLGDTLRVVIAGLIIGLPATWFFSRALQAQLYGVSSHDALTLSFAIALLLLIAFLASFLPARRAARVDPMSALRCE